MLQRSRMGHVRATGVFLAILLTTSPGLAAVEALPPGQMLPAQAEHLVTFDEVAAQRYGTTNSFGQFQMDDALFSGSAVIMRNGEDGSLPALGLYAEPYHDTTNYMAVLGDGSETITFAIKRRSFGLYWGSIDSYNSVSFWSSGRFIASFTGADLFPLLPIPFGDQKSDGSNRYVQFRNIGAFDAVTLASGGNSFEFDNVTSAVPEASTWLLMLCGLTGIALRSRRGSGEAAYVESMT